MAAHIGGNKQLILRSAPQTKLPFPPEFVQELYITLLRCFIVYCVIPQSKEDIPTSQRHRRNLAFEFLYLLIPVLLRASSGHAGCSKLSTSSFVLSVIEISLKNCISDQCKCQVLELVNDFKYLGITMDEKFLFQQHIGDLHKKLRSSITPFYFLRNDCSAALLRILYFALTNS